MQAVQILGHGKVAVVEAPDPEPRPGEVVVRIMSSALCGTERHVFEHGFPEGASAARLNGGHEAAGVVWKVAPGSCFRGGERVTLFAAPRHCGSCPECASGRWILCQAGEPVITRGFHAQYVCIREDMCLPLGDDISFEIGSVLTDALGTAWRAIRRLDVKAGERVLIMGQGPIGLSATMLCAHLGAEVIAADPLESRRDLALTCGASRVLDPNSEEVTSIVRGVTSGRGSEIAIDCAGFNTSRVVCLGALGPRGRAAFVGLGEGLLLDPATFRTHVFLNDITMLASWYSDPADIAELQDLVRQGLRAERMITERRPMSDAQHAFDAMFRHGSGKVVLEPWGHAASTTS